MVTAVCVETTTPAAGGLLEAWRFGHYGVGRWREGGERVLALIGGEDGARGTGAFIDDR